MSPSLVSKDAKTHVERNSDIFNLEQETKDKFTYENKIIFNDNKTMHF